MNKLDELFNEKQSFALAILDMDDFKKINDIYGHLIGDEVLVDFAEFLIEKTRKIDFVGRYGGEEFIAILQVNNIDQARAILDRVVKDLKNKELSTQNITLTFSGGVVWVVKKLYVAKSLGKNKIMYEFEDKDYCKIT